MHEPPSPGVWRRVLALLRAWPGGKQDRMQRAVPYVMSHVRQWPLVWRELALDHVVLVDGLQSRDMLGKWNFEHTSILPLVPGDAEWLRMLVSHLEYDEEDHRKLEPLIHAGMFSRVESLSFVHHEQLKGFRNEIVMLLTGRAKGCVLSELTLDTCFFDASIMHEFAGRVDLDELVSLRLRHSFKPSVVNELLRWKWGSLKELELLGDLLRVEDVNLLLMSDLCQQLKSIRLGHLLDAREDTIAGLYGNLLNWMENVRPMRLSLSRFWFSPEMLHQLATSPAAEYVEHLDVRDNVLSVSHMNALFGEDSRWKRLTHLRVGSGQESSADDLVDVLERSNVSAQLEFLDISKLHVLPYTQMKLLARLRFPALRHLALSYVQFSTEFFMGVSDLLEKKNELGHDEDVPWQTLLVKRATLYDVKDLEGLHQFHSKSSSWWGELWDVQIEMLRSRSYVRTSRGQLWGELLKMDEHHLFDLSDEVSAKNSMIERVWRTSLADNL